MNMKKMMLLVCCLLIYCLSSCAQEVDLEKIADSIKRDALVLYKSEMASWYGTDIFTDKCKDKRERIGGYLSYDTGNGENNIFFGRGENPDVLGTISFGYDFNLNTYKLDTIPRKLSDEERKLYIIRQKALQAFKTDTLFKRFNNTGVNLIPVIKDGKKLVYILTSPEQSGVVLFGNDYVLKFSENDMLVSKTKIHKDLLPAYYKKAPADSNKVEVAAMHSHLPTTGDFISVTDICTLMHYARYTTWNQYIVISRNYVSLWNCKKNDLLILTSAAWKKIAEDQKTRHPEAKAN
jgi:hypothetical protein